METRAHDLWNLRSGVRGDAYPNPEMASSPAILHTQLPEPDRNCCCNASKT